MILEENKLCCWLDDAFFLFFKILFKNVKKVIDEKKLVLCNVVWLLSVSNSCISITMHYSGIYLDYDDELFSQPLSFSFSSLIFFFLLLKTMKNSLLYLQTSILLKSIVNRLKKLKVICQTTNET